MTRDELIEACAKLAEGPSCARGAAACGHEICRDIEVAAAKIRALKTGAHFSEEDLSDDSTEGRT